MHNTDFYFEVEGVKRWKKPYWTDFTVDLSLIGLYRLYYGMIHEYIYNMN